MVEVPLDGFDVPVFGVDGVVVVLDELPPVVVVVVLGVVVPPEVPGFVVEGLLCVPGS